MRLRIAVLRMAVCVAVLSGGGMVRAQHDGDVWVGRTGDGQLAISPDGFIPEISYHALAKVDGPVFWGWTDNDPGFDGITDPDPEHDLYPLEPGCEIWLEVVLVDPAFRLIDGGFQILDEPGEATLLGGHTLHVHNTWHIDSTDHDFDPFQCVWQGAFVLLDLGSTGYATSDPIAFSFSNVPWGPASDPPVPATGDFDGDEDVDLTDHAALLACLAGPTQRPDPDDPGVTTCEVECLNAFDFDEDLDVDLLDVAEFQTVFSGA